MSPFKKIPVILSVAVLAVAVVLFASIFLVSADVFCSGGSTCKLAGWLYSENYGYISLNSDNVVSSHNLACSGGASGCQYAVSIDNLGNISGYGWSENVGWVCFGDGHDSTTLGCVGSSPFSGTNLTTQLNASGTISGVAQVVSVGDNGWIKLGTGLAASDPNNGPGQPQGEECYGCYPQCDTYYPCPNIDPSSGDGQCSGGPSNGKTCKASNSQDVCGCSQFPIPIRCQTCFTKTRFCASSSDLKTGCSQPTSTPDLAVTGGSGSVCRYNTGCKTQSDVLRNKSRVTCDSSSDCHNYGLDKVTSTGQIVGWGWGGDIGEKEGAGWVQTMGKTSIIYPWLQTSYGSIYTPDAFRQKAQMSVNNATYCLFANGVQSNFNSSNCSSPISNIGIGFLTSTPSGANQTYYNALGLLDVNGLMSTSTSNYDKYGYKVEDISGGFLGDSLILGNKIYLARHDLTVNSLTFSNGHDIINGNGTIIVNGDLHINGNLYYDTSIVADGNLKNLPSVAWIVKGDVIIDKDVKNIVGAFLVLGNGTNLRVIPNGDINYPHYVPDLKSGVFFSGSSALPLTVLGMVAARAFDLERTYSSLIQGSERIIYDGRLIANPPPGLKGFSEGLPVIRDFSY